MSEQVVVGIDVSKARLEIAVLPGGEQFAVANDRDGIGRLVQRLKPSRPKRVVLEATGKLERLAVSELASAGLQVVVVNPGQVRHLCQSAWQTGQKRSHRCAPDRRIRLGSGA